MIKEDNIKQEWDVYSAEDFSIKFEISDKFDGSECDEEYIMRHLEEDSRVFKVMFMKSYRDNAYEEYWKIQELEQEPQIIELNELGVNEIKVNIKINNKKYSGCLTEVEK